MTRSAWFRGYCALAVVPIVMAAVMLSTTKPAFAMPAEGHPAAGSYLGPGQFYDSGGLTIAWQESDVSSYAPGAVPTYWKVQMVYRNVGNSDITYSASGFTDPNLVYEDMEGTGDSGIVHAESTFNSANPGYVHVLTPGESLTVWALFHNVPWTGGTVSIRWMDYGSTPAVDPWTQHLVVHGPRS